MVVHKTRTTLLLLLTMILRLAGLSFLVFLASAQAEEQTCEEPAQPIVTLANGVQMPILSLGMAHATFGSKHRDNNATFIGFYPELAYRQVELGLQNGVRAFDTALMYGTQPHLGMVLGQWLASGKLKREDVFITTKVFHAPAPGFGLTKNHQVNLNFMTPEEVAKQTEEHIEQCLKELGTGYIDLMLMHWPSDKGQHEDISRQRRLAAWKVLETIYDRGWLRAIGVSNFSEEHLKDLRSDGATIQPMVNQIEASPYLQFNKIIKYCKTNNIQVQSYSPLGSGLLDVKNDPLLQQIANKKKKDVGQVVFRYLIQRGYVVTYKTSSAERMVTNQQVFDFKLNRKQMDEINALNKADGSWGLPSPYDLP